MAFQALNKPSSALEHPTAPNYSVSSLASGRTTATYPHHTTAPSAIDEAFASKPEIQAAIHRILKSSGQPEQQALFERIALYVLELQQSAAAAASGTQDDRLTKRRKLDTGGSDAVAESIVVASAPPAARAGPTAAANADPFATWSDGERLEGISFTVPQRKKLTLELGAAGSGIRALNGNGQSEFGLPYSELEGIYRLPVPEKAQRMHNFCAFPRGTGREPIVWTAPDTLPKGADTTTLTPSGAMRAALNRAGIAPNEPNADVFASALEEPHRKGETCFHVKGFLGSKEGFLYFLASGIVWGFRKPLMFFSHANIEAVSFTAVLQRTFNLVISARENGATEASEIEFGMLDQAEFEGLNAYVQHYGLNDASMAEDRRAKHLNINGPVKSGEPGKSEAGGAEGDEGELAKAQREAAAQPAPDEEDDEEDDENFDPGSDGESEGSGSSDDDDDDEDGEDGEGGGDSEGDNKSDDE